MEKREKERLFVVVRYHQVVNPFFVGTPSLVEVEVVVYSLLVRWSLVVGYGPYPSSVEVDCGCIASVALYG